MAVAGNQQIRSLLTKWLKFQVVSQSLEYQSEPDLSDVVRKHFDVRCLSDPLKFQIRTLERSDQREVWRKTICTRSPKNFAESNECRVERIHVVPTVL